MLGEGVSGRHPLLMIPEYGPAEALNHQIWMTTTHPCRREPPFVNKAKEVEMPVSGIDFAYSAIVEAEYAALDAALARMEANELSKQAGATA